MFHNNPTGSPEGHLFRGFCLSFGLGEGDGGDRVSLRGLT